MRASQILIPVVAIALCCPLAMAAPPSTRKATPTPSTTISAEAIPLLEKGLAANAKGETTLARQLFQQALSKMGPVDSNLSIVYNGLANAFLKEKQYAQALIWAKKNHAAVIKRYGANSEEDANNAYFVGNLYFWTKDLAQAEANAKHALSIYEALEKAGKYPSFYAPALQNMGVIQAEKGDYQRAVAYYQKALSIKEKQQDEETGNLWENIGMAYQHLKQVEQATQAYKQAIAAYEKTRGSDSPEAQRVHFKLSNINPAALKAEGTSKPDRYDGSFYRAGQKAYNIDRNYAEAARQFKLALEQVLRFYPHEEELIAVLNASLGQALYMADSEEAPEPYLEKALAYRKQQGTPDSDSALLDLRRVLGMAYQQKGEYEKAEAQFQIVLQHGEAGTETYSSTLASQAEVLCHQGEFDEARELYKQALSFYQQQPTQYEKAIRGVEYHLALLDKMFQSQTQGLSQYFEYSVDGLRHWNEGPIRIRIETGEMLNGWNPQNIELVRNAFLEWQCVLNGKLQFQFTDDPERTDVLVHWTDKPIAESDMDAQVGYHRLETVRGFFLRSDILLALSKDSKLRSRADIYATALHEIGHMLGLSHSSNLSDIMAAVGNFSYSNKDWPRLSERDREAVHLLYQQPAVVSNPPGITLAEYQKFNEIALEGSRLLREHRYRQALHILEQARELYEHDPYINFYYGLSAFQRGQYKKARDIFETAPMPNTTSVFSVDKQLGLIYVELGHQYNKWGRKNRQISAEFYNKGVQHLQLALQKPNLPPDQQAYLQEKLKEAQLRKRPEPVYTFNNYSASPVIQYRYHPGF